MQIKQRGEGGFVALSQMQNFSIFYVNELRHLRARALFPNAILCEMHPSDCCLHSSSSAIQNVMFFFFIKMIWFWLSTWFFLICVHVHGVGLALPSQAAQFFFPLCISVFFPMNFVVGIANAPLHIVWNVPFSLRHNRIGCNCWLWQCVYWQHQFQFRSSNAVKYSWITLLQCIKKWKNDHLIKSDAHILASAAFSSVRFCCCRRRR